MAPKIIGLDHQLDLSDLQASYRTLRTEQHKQSIPRSSQPSIFELYKHSATQRNLEEALSLIGSNTKYNNKINDNKYEIQLQEPLSIPKQQDYTSTSFYKAA